MYVDRREKFVNICVDMLFKYQWHIKKHGFNAGDLKPGLIFVITDINIREATQIYYSKLDIISR